MTTPTQNEQTQTEPKVRMAASLKESVAKWAERENRSWNQQAVQMLEEGVERREKNDSL